MVEDERMKVLSFTGSDAVGWKLKALAGASRCCSSWAATRPA